MIFAAWSGIVVAIGAAVIGALLFALQHLRVHRRTVRLAATPLWSQAVRAAPPRVLGGRFRRPLAFLLALAIALALWLAASRPERAAAPDGGFHIFYLDASALMTGGDAFAHARRALLSEVAAVPSRERAVYLGDGYGTRLLGAGEDGALLAARLAGIEARPRPPSFAAWLKQAVADRGRGGPVTVHYFGQRAVFEATSPPAPGVRLVAGSLAEPAGANRGIVALGVSPAASGAWDRGDVLVTLWDSSGRVPPAGDLVWRLGGTTLADARVDPLGGGRYALRDVPAAGQPLEVAFRRGDAFAADDHAAIMIPDRRAVRVAIGAGVPATVARVLRLDPAFRLVAPADAQVIVRLASDRSAATLPSLVLTDPAAEAATFVVTVPKGEQDGSIADRLDALGLRQIDAAGLADALGRPIAVREARPAGARSIAAWQSLFADRTGFARSPAMPLFVSQAVRWLAGPTPWIPYAAAGGMLPDQSALYGLAADPALTARAMGDGIYLPWAGALTIAGREVRVSLTDSAVSRMAAAPATARPAIVDTAPAAADLLLPALLLLAGLLLALEWRLFQRGWMP